MCGICGKMIFKEVVPEKELISEMCKTIKYRGPDDEGVYTAPHIGLGQRRLAIIDLDSSSCPPLSNEDKSIWLVFNGEIYNYKELRKVLQSCGHRFKTNSDTEVIIHLYEDKGIDCLKYLDGMFALALWDSKKKRIFCARDRFGKKPFCYTRTDNSFVFGSEIKAITADPEISIAPDYGAIDLYLSYQFVPSPYTAFENIHRLGPGEYLLCSTDGQITTNSYWEPPIAKDSSLCIQDMEDKLLWHLRESIKKRMISDVPLGAFLSGGIDSGTIVALMAQESSLPVKTFSIGFEEESHNELPFARLVAERYGTDHHEMIVKPNAAEILPLLVKHYNEPFADSSAIPTYYVSKITREHVTVALSGDGGDEVFAGYMSYKILNKWEAWNMVPLWLRQSMASRGKSFNALLPYNNITAKFERGLSLFSAANVKERRLLSGTIIKEDEKRMLYTLKYKEILANKKSGVDPLSLYPWISNEQPIEWLMRHDQRFYLPDCLMVKSDIASMANSLEVRAPLLDHKLVEFASTIPSCYKYNYGLGKIILRKLADDLLPSDVLRKPKTGFAVPIAKWFRCELAPLLRETLLSEKFNRRGLFDRKYLKKMVEEHIGFQRDWSNRLWAIMFLELWFQEYID